MIFSNYATVHTKGNSDTYFNSKNSEHNTTKNNLIMTKI